MLKKITRQQDWQITGLLTLARTTLSQLEAIEESLNEVLEVVEADHEVSGIGDPGHIGDAIYSRYSSKELLKKLGIKKA